MLGLIDVLGWIITIVLIVGGVVLLIGMFVGSSGWEKFLGVVAVIVGVIVFVKVYAWMDSIGVALFATGFVLCMFGAGSNGHSTSSNSTSQRSEERYTLGQAAMDTICEYELTKAAVKDAIRESKE